MADADKKPRDWQAHLIDPRLLLGATTVIILLLAALPFYKDHEALLTPADQARMARQSLRDQLALSQAPDLSTGRDAATSDERQPVTRDIFRPVAAAEAPVLNREGVLSTAAAETAAKPRALELTGVFLDGPRAQAAINGQIVSEGDSIKGFNVVEIHKDWVVLVKGNTVRPLWLGGEP